MTTSESRLPAVFLSHGTPMLALMEDDYTRALAEFASRLPRPRAIVVLSAHAVSPGEAIEISASKRLRAVHDFRGFPPDLYQLGYDCPGSPEVAAEAAALLASAGFQTALVDDNGIDHGVWIPLRIAFPHADVPVVRITMPYPVEPKEILRMGKALGELRNRGVLILGTGGAVHNLSALEWSRKHGPGARWAHEFNDWLKAAIRKKDVAALLAFEQEAPSARVAHPTVEHFYPLLFAIGASQFGDEAITIYDGFNYESLSMYSFALQSSPEQ